MHLNPTHILAVAMGPENREEFRDGSFPSFLIKPTYKPIGVVYPRAIDLYGSPYDNIAQPEPIQIVNPSRYIGMASKHSTGDFVYEQFYPQSSRAYRSEPSMVQTYTEPVAIVEPRGDVFRIRLPPITPMLPEQLLNSFQYSEWKRRDGSVDIKPHPASPSVSTCLDRTTVASPSSTTTVGVDVSKPTCQEKVILTPSVPLPPAG